MFIGCFRRRDTFQYLELSNRNFPGYSRTSVVDSCSSFSYPLDICFSPHVEVALALLFAERTFLLVATLSRATAVCSNNFRDFPAVACTLARSDKLFLLPYSHRSIFFSSFSLSSSLFFFFCRSASSRKFGWSLCGTLLQYTSCDPTSFFKDSCTTLSRDKTDFLVYFTRGKFTYTKEELRKVAGNRVIFSKYRIRNA